MVLLAAPVFIPLLITTTFSLMALIALWRALQAFLLRHKALPKTIELNESTEYLEAVRNGYSKQIGLSVDEIFIDPIGIQDIDRILTVRKNLFPKEYCGSFYSSATQDFSPTEFKALALRLFLEMAFVRTYLLAQSPSLWSQRAEEIWIYHTPKPLRKLNPDYYRQLLGKLKQDFSVDRSSKAA